MRNIFTKQLAAVLATDPAFSMAEEQDLPTILNELGLQLSGLLEDTNAVAVGNRLEADVLISSTLQSDENGHTLILKLLRVETAEVL